MIVDHSGTKFAGFKCLGERIFVAVELGEDCAELHADTTFKFKLD